MAVNNTPDFLAMAKTIKNDAVRYASVKGLQFFQESFQKQGFTNTTFQPWQKRANDIDPGRKLLVKSAYLLNSLEVMEANEKRIVFGSDAPYADIHNTGGTITVRVTEKARRYFWFMYKRTGKDMWKAMALSRKQTRTIKIPKRQFIGHSDTLMNDLNQWLSGHLIKQFKQA